LQNGYALALSSSVFSHKTSIIATQFHSQFIIGVSILYRLLLLKDGGQLLQPVTREKITAVGKKCILVKENTLTDINVSLRSV
jgi:hypothetical protein